MHLSVNLKVLFLVLSKNYPQEFIPKNIFCAIVYMSTKNICSRYGNISCMLAFPKNILIN